MAAKLGEILVQKKLITETQLETALQEQEHSGKFLGEILMQFEFITEDDLLKVLAEQFSTRYVTLDSIRVNPRVLKLVPRSMAQEHGFLPIDIRASVLLIAVSNPLDMWPLSQLQSRMKIQDVQVVLAKKKDIEAAIVKFYGAQG